MMLMMLVEPFGDPLRLQDGLPYQWVLPDSHKATEAPCKRRTERPDLISFAQTRATLHVLRVYNKRTMLQDYFGFHLPHVCKKGFGAAKHRSSKSRRGLELREDFECTFNLEDPCLLLDQQFSVGRA